MTTVLSAEDHRVVDRVDYWRHALSTAFVPLEASPIGEPDEPLSGRLRLAELGGLQLAQVSGSGQVVRRRLSLIRRRDPECLKVGLQLRGRGVLEQDGRQALLSPGDFAVYSTSRPYTLTFDEHFTMLVVMFPREMLPFVDVERDGRTAVRIEGARGVGSLVSPFLRRLGELMDEPEATLDPDTTRHLADSAVDMIAAGLTDLADLGGQAPGRHRRPEALLRQVHTYIEANLDDADLCPAKIASVHHISVRHLQNLFHRSECTVSAWIRGRRLERCRRDLGDPTLHHLPVSAVAARSGLVDAAHFSRLFRARYGRSPKEFRQECVRGVPATPDRNAA
jgi:AraC-like DNA-binding protein